jgi:hypothetical protein
MVRLNRAKGSLRPDNSGRIAEQRNELASFHCPGPPVLPNEGNSTSRYGRGLLRCGISVRPMSQRVNLGKSRIEHIWSGLPR